MTYVEIAASAINRVIAKSMRCVRPARCMAW